MAPSTVSAVPAADSASALAHFESSLSFETDCWDVSTPSRRATPTSCCSMFAAPSFSRAAIFPAHSICHTGKSSSLNCANIRPIHYS